MVMRLAKVIEEGLGRGHSDPFGYVIEPVGNPL
jgi:hypothetical protein